MQLSAFSILKRVTAWSLSGLCLAVIGGAVWLHFNTDRIESSLIHSLDYHLLTDSHIETMELRWWSTFPEITLSLEQCWIVGSPVSGAEEDTLLTVESLRFSLYAPSLIFGEPKIESISLSGFELRLESGTGGTLNTDVWREKAAPDAGGETTFSVSDLDLKDGRVSWSRAGNGSGDAWGAEIPAATLSISAAGDLVEGEIDGEFRPLFNEWVGPMCQVLASAQVDTVGAWLIDLETLGWAGASFGGNIAGQANGTWEAEAVIESLNWPAVLQAAVVDTEPALDSFRTDAIAHGTLSASSDGPWSGQLQWDESTLVFTPTGERWEVGALVGFRYEKQKWRFDVPAARLSAPGIIWAGELSSAGEQITADGTLDLTYPLALGAWPSFIDQPKSLLQPGWKGAASWTGKLDYSPRSETEMTGTWQIHELTWADGVGGPWEFQGTGTAQHIDTLEVITSSCAFTLQGPFNLSEPGVHANLRLRSSALDLDALMAEGEVGAEGRSDVPDLRLPVGSAIDLEITADYVLLFGARWDSLTVEATLTRDRWSTTNMVFSPFAGRASSRLIWDIFPNKWLLGLDGQFTSVSAPDLFRAFQNFDQSTLRAEHLKGRLSGDFTMNTSWDAGVWESQTLALQGNFSWHDGALNRVEAFDEMADYLRANRLMAPLVDPTDLAQRLQHIEFSHVQSPLWITQGIVHVPPIEIASSAMEISIEGLQHFHGEIDYTLGFALRDLRNTRSDDIGEIAEDGLGNRFFLNMSGPLESPVYSYDRNAHREHRREKIQAEKERLKSLFRR